MGDDRAERRQSPYGVSKRARQACGNCRRKKSKCTGEKPACSFCVRLQQDCVYARHQHSPSNHEEDLRGSELATSHGTRLSAIETQLKQMAAAIDDTQPPFSKAILSEGIKLFFSEYYNQPCPLLSELYTFNPETDDPPPSIILYPMLALSMRSSHTYLNEGVSKWELLDRFTRSSWDLFAEAYSAFDFNDEYLLGLCILVQVDAGDGRMERARTQVSLGLQVAQSQGLLSADSLDGLEPIIRTRRQEIVWSLFLLDRMMLGASSRYPSLPSAAFELPLCGNGPTPRNWNPQMQSATSSIVRLHTEANHVQYSVLSLNIKIMSIWENVIVDVTRSPSDTDVPLWRHNSPRASLLTQIMEFETICQMSFHHYSSTGPPTRVLVDPSLRDYFVVWIYFQLVLSVTQCCLNHPFIIYTQTIHHRHVMPITFLQKSYEQSMIYANWVARLLDDIENAHLAVRNPFLGRLVAIAASIHLEYTINQNPKIAVPARMKFERCVNFVKRVAQEWPDMMKTVSGSLSFVPKCM
ncbi:hypothetical protein COCC4DRAFT_70770 [Bipolaris maydis ATCC 48331]|uniref:Zn(2)-C6 fungal-type domain-containing protein n=2 Tax=Cochliobolus heterostrophus TaxID=5016 RepID=M2SPR7_COCH5|nr:uncharacterized protein COCC4DRAFT_70770 [Bipolaris maydis ATCC 48331]EMD87300.1 hypothetical protein COCHEDRAFT_1184151 [Bipolaris maydis C5]KAJ5023401.1 hypothetical protein J3E73DRAFT_433997 [Bipolaris maydis]ENI06499.1 hypothetical protein COCC4DRAFT_70770 [Bipolaris maydis ATCC 48331]KAJ6212291.1 hypothetical protein PSV09DRAFT_1184151 [Bipolaris maydis]KAJ6277423.1 hypothetical protein J3E71DRAFT_394303 [Bipolaris maydis]